ncbi:hypothetical protein GCM10023144_06560 [Pigmentiphaga soli]|uniref:Type II toxin-antitoxin system PemK/MazF family toxin n=1 Tax=Pigmentiphaga soli TaxID=1007095 RepID=A0ABP8GI02_9BURK
MTVLPLTSDIRKANLIRITVEPLPQKGLRTTSQVMIDKATTVPRTRVGGRIDAPTMKTVDTALARFLHLRP